MEVTAKLRYARITPRKARLVAQLLGGLPVGVAEVHLRVLHRRAAPLILKILRSAVANAKENFHLDAKDLRVGRVLVNEGPRLKRWMPRARGAADRIIKRTSHIEVVLTDEREMVMESPAERKRPRLSAANVQTVGVQELSPDELKHAAGKKRGGGPGRWGSPTRAVKPSETPRGVRRLVERKHGGE